MTKFQNESQYMAKSANIYVIDISKFSTQIQIKHGHY